MDYKKVISYIFKAKKYMTTKEIEEKRMAHQTKHWDSFNKSEKFFYFLFFFTMTTVFGLILRLF